MQSDTFFLLIITNNESKCQVHSMNIQPMANITSAKRTITPKTIPRTFHLFEKTSPDPPDPESGGGSVGSFLGRMVLGLVIMSA